jgi:hypothetical protein
MVTEKLLFRERIAHFESLEQAFFQVLDAAVLGRVSAAMSAADISKKSTLRRKIESLGRLSRTPITIRVGGHFGRLNLKLETSYGCDKLRT